MDFADLHLDEPPYSSERAAEVIRQTATVDELDTGDGFFVEADGVGIAAEDSEIEFDPSYSTSDDGARIGLTIVQRVVDQHGRRRWWGPVRDPRCGTGV